jgi:hypothetical protein
MVGQGDEPPEKTVEEIQLEAEEEIARAAHLTRDAERGKRHNGLQDNSGASDDEPRDATPLRRYRSKFNRRCPIDRGRLRDRSRSIREEISQNEYQGEQVHRMPAHNALASRMLIDQLTFHLPKDNEEINAVDPVFNCNGEVRGHKLDH